MHYRIEYRLPSVLTKNIAYEKNSFHCNKFATFYEPNSFYNYLLISAILFLADRKEENQAG